MKKIAWAMMTPDDVIAGTSHTRACKEYVPAEASSRVINPALGKSDTASRFFLWLVRRGGLTRTRASRVASLSRDGTSGHPRTSAKFRAKLQRILYPLANHQFMPNKQAFARNPVGGNGMDLHYVCTGAITANDFTMLEAG